MTQTELAQELNVSKAYISMVLNGKKKPSKRVAERLKEVNFEVNSERGKDYPKSCSSASSDTSPQSTATHLRHPSLIFILPQEV